MILSPETGSEEAVLGPSVFPSREPGVSGDFWGSQEGCQGTGWDQVPALHLEAGVGDPVVAPQDGSKSP